MSTHKKKPSLDGLGAALFIILGSAVGLVLLLIAIKNGGA